MIEKYLNKITCGDSYKLIKELPDKSVDLIVTDPPYQIEELSGGGMLQEKRIMNLMIMNLMSVLMKKFLMSGCVF